MAIFKGTSAKDTFTGTAENDSFLYINAGDTADGGAGSDMISLSLGTYTTAVTYDAIAATTATGVKLPGGVIVRNMERLGSLQTGSGDDKLIISINQGPFNWDGGAGNDTLKVNFVAATDYVFMSATTTTFSLHAMQWADNDFAEAYNVESIDITGSTFGDFLTGGAGNDTVRGWDGDDVLNPGRGGIDLVDGGKGFDRIVLDYAAVTGNIVYDATVAATADGAQLFNGTVIKNVEGIRALTTGSGNDKLIVGAGTRDFGWIAGAGNDVLVADYSKETGAIHVANAVSPNGLVTVITAPSMPASFRGEAYGIEQLYITGSKYDDGIQGTWGNDRLDGGLGGDTLEGQFGNDTYVVDNLHDVVVERAGEGTDIVFASVNFHLAGAYIENLSLLGSANLFAEGNDLDNRIYGNDGDNRIVGGRGNDALVGGKGADTFAFAAGSGKDRISDFSAAQGDTLDLNAYHAKATTTISQHGADSWVDLGGGNVIVLSNVTATDPGFLSHIIW